MKEPTLNSIDKKFKMCEYQGYKCLIQQSAVK